MVRELGLGMDAVEELFRRAAFNVAARNQDDHTKNIAFLMDKSRDLVARARVRPDLRVQPARAPGPAATR